MSGTQQLKQIQTQDENLNHQNNLDNNNDKEKNNENSSNERDIPVREILLYILKRKENNATVRKKLAREIFDFFSGEYAYLLKNGSQARVKLKAFKDATAALKKSYQSMHEKHSKTNPSVFSKKNLELTIPHINALIDWLVDNNYNLDLREINFYIKKLQSTERSFKKHCETKKMYIHYINTLSKYEELPYGNISEAIYHEKMIAIKTNQPKQTINPDKSVIRSFSHFFDNPYKKTNVEYPQVFKDFFMYFKDKKNDQPIGYQARQYNFQKLLNALELNTAPKTVRDHLMDLTTRVFIHKSSTERNCYYNLCKELAKLDKDELIRQFNNFKYIVNNLKKGNMNPFTTKNATDEEVKIVNKFCM